MYSVKPGRGPSLLGAIVGIVVAIMGVFWTFTATSHGAPALFAVFGVFFVILALGGVLYNMFNATSPNRVSTYDITGPGEERDPVGDALIRSRPIGAETAPGLPAGSSPAYCSGCGRKLEGSFKFCPGCGRPV